MNFCVLDCSVAIAWCFEDEATARTDKLLEAISKKGAYVPALWHLEIGNTLIQAFRRKRCSVDHIFAQMETLKKLPITTDTSHTIYIDTITDIAIAEKLTSYDATYLELALRHNLPLATNNKALIKACKRAGGKQI